MNKRNLSYFKRWLVRELEALLSGADCNFDGLKNTNEKCPDLIDRASSFITENYFRIFVTKKVFETG